MAIADLPPILAAEPNQPDPRRVDMRHGLESAFAIDAGETHIVALAQLMGRRAAEAAIQAGRKPALTSGTTDTGTVPAVLIAPSKWKDPST